LFLSESTFEFPEGKEWHQHDEHDDSDHEYSLQCSAADFGNALQKRLAMPGSDKRFLDYMEAHQYHGKNSRLEHDWIDERPIF